MKRLLAKLPWREVCAAIPALVLLVALSAYYAAFVSDDAFISFRYAEHLATGRGLEWNPGYRVEGYSNFLWVVILAGFRVLGASIPTTAAVLSWLCAAVSVLLIVVAVRREGERPFWPVVALAPLTIVLSFPYHWWTSMRLETAAFGMLLLLALLLFDREEERPEAAQWPSAVVLLCLALLRPEGATFIAVPGLYILFRLRSLDDLRRQLRRRWLWLAIFFGGLLIYHLWRVIYFGDLFPNTYYAKVVHNALSEGWIYLERFVTERPYHVILFCGALLAGGVVSRLSGLLLAAVVLLTVLIVLEGGDWMREWRLFMPAMPLVAANLGCGLRRAVEGAGWPRKLTALAGLGVLLVGMQSSMGTPLKEWELAFKGERRDLLINMEGELTRASREVGLWLKKRGRPDDLVAVNHAGAVPYYSELPTLDMAGLNDLHISRLKDRGQVHTKWDADYVLSRKPAFFVLNTRHYPVGWRYVPGYWRGETEVVNHPDFQRYYVPVKKVWSWRGLPLAVRDHPHMAGTFFIMVYRRVKGDRLKPVAPCLDFESGTWRGWTVEGDAFGPHPLSTKTRPGGRPEPYLGRFLADSRRHTGSDKPRGKLRSDPFTVKGDRIELHVGGGVTRGSVGVRLLVEGRAVENVGGRNDHRMWLEIWDVKRFRGKQAVVEVYDESSGDWGHIVVDSICQYRGER